MRLIVFLLIQTALNFPQPDIVNNFYTTICKAAGRWRGGGVEGFVDIIPEEVEIIRATGSDSGVGNLKLIY